MPHRRERVEAIVVGAGLMGRWHTHAIRRVGSTLAAIVDPDASRAHALSRRSGAGTAFPDLDSALASCDASVVHVCTPSHTHEALAEQAIAAGRHVLVEKPLAGDALVTERLLATAHSRGVLLAPVHQFSFQPGVLEIARRPQRVGNVLHVRGSACSAGAVGAEDAEKDRIAGEILPHFLSVILPFLPTGLKDVAWTVLRPRAGELRVGGAAGSTSIDISISMGTRPTRTTLDVEGDRGSARLDLFHGFAVLEPGAVSRSRKITRPFRLSAVTLARASGNLFRRAVRRQPAYPGLRELIGAFHSAVAHGGPSPIAPAETLSVAEARDRILGLLDGPPPC